DAAAFRERPKQAAFRETAGEAAGAGSGTAVARPSDGGEVSVPLEGVLFDVDGTVVDSNDAHARAWRSALAAAGFAVPYDEVRRMGLGGDKLLPELTGRDEDHPRAKDIKEYRRRIFRERELPTVRAFPGTRDLLERLRQDGLRRAVASSAEREELARELEQA